MYKILILFFCISTNYLFAADYHIGPSYAYNDINIFAIEVGFQQLQPGDHIYIHYRSTPYRSFIFINTNDLTITGVADDAGNLPVIDGAGAIQPILSWQDSNNFYTETDGINDPDPLNPNVYTYYNGGLYNLGLITIGRKSGSNYTDVPSNIIIENLEIRNAHQDQTFTPWFSGLVANSHPYAATYNNQSKHFASFVSGIRVQRGENITIKNCHIHQCGNGIFVNSVVDDNNGNGNFDAGDVSLISRNILIEQCYIHDNGCYNGNSCHNIYCEASGSIYQYNYLGSKKAGSSDSNCLKDRSAGTIVRFNYIEGINQGHLLDLVEAEASSPLMIYEPNYHNTYIYGNTLINPPSGPITPIHYGGDHCDYDIYRRGNLYFFNNTFLNIANQSQKYRTSLFFFPVSNYFSGPPWCTVSPASFDESLIATNNIIFNIPSTIGSQPSEVYLLQTDLLSNHSFDHNFISSGYQNGFSGVWDFTTNQYKPFIANVSHNQTHSPAINEPGFVDFNASDFHLQSNAFCRDQGNSNLNPQLVDKEYVYPQTFSERYLDSSIDLGAFEYQNPLSIHEYAFSVSKLQNSIHLEWHNLKEYLHDVNFNIHRIGADNVEMKLNISPLSDFDHYEDIKPNQGWNSYKVCTNSQNQIKRCTEIKSVFYNNNHLAYPNPAFDFVILPQYDGFNGIYTISDFNGKIINTILHNGTNTIKLEHLQVGNYILHSILGSTKIIKVN